MDKPVLTPSDFHAAFPQFADAAKYPDSVIQMFINQALCTMELDASPCYSFYYYILTAHLLALFAGLKKNQQGGFIVSSSIDAVSVSKLAPPAATTFDWWLAQTGYGQQLLAMLQIDTVGGFSAGGLPERSAFRKVNGTFA